MGDRAVVTVSAVGSERTAWRMREGEAEQLNAARKLTQGAPAHLTLVREDGSPVAWECGCDASAVEAQCVERCAGRELAASAATRLRVTGCSASCDVPVAGARTARLPGRIAPDRTVLYPNRKPGCSPRDQGDVMPARQRAFCAHGSSRAMLRALLMCTSIAASAACGSTSTSTAVSPSPARCGVAATPTPSAFPASGGTGNLAVASARECSWSVSSSVASITLASPVDGQGAGSVRYTVAANPAATARHGAIVFGSQSAEIAQEAAACRVELDRSSFDYPAGEQSDTITVRAPAGCGWTARTDVPWIAIVEGSQGNGDGVVRFRTAANAATASRSGSIDVAGVRVSVRQAGGASPCTYVASPDSLDVGPGQTDGSVSVRTDAGCAWTATSDQAWLTVTAGTSGRGAGDVRYHATMNATASARTGHIMAAGTVFTLRQAACKYAINPTSASFGANGGSGVVGVQTQSPCAWSAETAFPWIVLTSGSQGTGDGRVTFQVQANTNTAQRAGTAIVAGRAFTVSQQGEPSFSGFVEDLERSCPDIRFSVNGQHIRATNGTTYEDGDCAHVRNGVHVIVKGLVGNDGVLTAIEIDF